MLIPVSCDVTLPSTCVINLGKNMKILLFVTKLYEPLAAYENLLCNAFITVAIIFFHIRPPT